MADASEVLGLAARLDRVAEQVAAEAADLSRLGGAEWSGLAAAAYRAALDDAARHARAVERAVAASAATLRRHAAAVEAARGGPPRSVPWSW